MIVYRETEAGTEYLESMSRRSEAFWTSDREEAMQYEQAEAAKICGLLVGRSTRGSEKHGTYGVIA